MRDSSRLPWLLLLEERPLRVIWFEKMGMLWSLVNATFVMGALSEHALTTYDGSFSLRHA